jgi:GrpB-like predicted nucleotidyltransferase (UPF0157 family)
VVIVRYDPNWPLLFQEERISILRVAGPTVLDVEHIGSTAVPGLAAKPIVDMMAGVQGSSEADQCLPMLARIGYRDVFPEPDNEEWFYCLGKSPHSPGYHLHLVKHGSEHWNRHLLFRNYLRKHRDVAQQYQELKIRMAQEQGSDREAYTRSKTLFIESVLRQAEKEAP